MAIKERLGHSSITVTMDRYGGLFPRLDEAIAEGLNEVLRASLAASTRPDAASDPDRKPFAQVRALQPA